MMVTPYHSISTAAHFGFYAPAASIHSNDF